LADLEAGRMEEIHEWNGLVLIADDILALPVEREHPPVPFPGSKSAAVEKPSSSPVVKSKSALMPIAGNTPVRGRPKPVSSAL